MPLNKPSFIAGIQHLVEPSQSSRHTSPTWLLVSNRWRLTPWPASKTQSSTSTKQLNWRPSSFVSNSEKSEVMKSRNAIHYLVANIKLLQLAAIRDNQESSTLTTSHSFLLHSVLVMLSEHTPSSSRAIISFGSQADCVHLWQLSYTMEQDSHKRSSKTATSTS